MSRALRQPVSSSRTGLRKAWPWQVLTRSLPLPTSKAQLGLLDLPNELILRILEEAVMSAPGTLHATLRANRTLRSLTLHMLKDAMHPHALPFSMFDTTTHGLYNGLDCFCVFTWIPHEFQSFEEFQRFSTKLTKLRRKWHERTTVGICVHSIDYRSVDYWGCPCHDTYHLPAEDAMPEWGPVMARVLYIMWERDRLVISIIKERNTFVGDVRARMQRLKNKLDRRWALKRRWTGQKIKMGY
ncbi:hypothetical protein PMIN03_007788 [Paraphaeosphaeria minitans]